MVEVFTDCKTYEWLETSQPTKISLLITIYLVLKGYFKDLYRLIDAKVPSSLIEPSATPPTPFAGAVKDLVVKPLALLDKHTDEGMVEKKRLAYSTFVCDILSPPMTSQVCYFLVPSLSTSIPLSPILEAIDTTDDTHTVWALYSVLTLFDKQYETFPKEDTSLLVRCVKVLIKTLVLKKESLSSSGGVGGSDVVYDSDSDSDSDMETNNGDADDTTTKVSNLSSISIHPSYVVTP
jgi:hypothetical protein